MHTTLAVPALVLAATSSKSSGSPIGTFVLLAVILLGGYFLLLRPARRRQRQAVETRSNVSIGDSVTTTAGLLATVVDIDDEALTLEVAPGVRCRYLPAAIMRVNTPPEDPEVIEQHEAIVDPDAASDPTRVEHHDERRDDEHGGSPGEPTSA